MKHRSFGTDMWVAEDRVEEYKAAGHVLAAKPIPTKKEHEEVENRSVKKIAKKR